MATLLYRLGKTAFRRWPFFIAAWLVVLIGIGAVASGFGKPMVDAFSIPGIPSERAADLQAELFPGAGDALDQATVNVVVQAPEGTTLSDPEVMERVDEVVSDLAALPQMPEDPQLANPVVAAEAQRQQLLAAAEENGTPTEVAEANAAALSPLSADGTVGIITYEYDVESITDVEPETREQLELVLNEARDFGLTAEANGPGMAQMIEGAAAELIGIAVALVVLVVTFGSLVAAGLPIVTALVGVGIGTLGVTAATIVTDIGSTTPILATMIGLAVGIDYALFILARYRSELHHVEDREEAVGISVGTAGSAVVFAGLTVIIALAALAVVRIPFLTAMGVAAAATVAVAVLVALTLLPAILGMLRRRAFAGQVLRYQPERDDQGHILNSGVRWARLVGRAPVLGVLLPVVVLGSLAIPLKDLHLAFPTDSTASTETTQRQASDLIEDAFGPGRESPMLVVVDGREVEDPQARPAAYGEVVSWAAQQEGVTNAQIVTMNEDATGAQVLVTPETGPENERTEELLHALRDGQGDIEAETGAELGVTGITPITVDVSERLADALPVYLTVVIGLAFVLLVLVFRSILVPLTATLGFLLSVLATLGVTVAVFQRGTFGWFEPQPIVSFMPIFLIGVVFGLAMDYQVFLVTRIREAHIHGASFREAVVDGFRNSARVVTAAALIMTSVFAAFMLMDDPIIKSMGFALAIAVLFDAFIIRMLLIPALLYLMHEKSWWMPAWLDRVLPEVDVEGEKLDRPHLDDHYRRAEPQPVA